MRSAGSQRTYAQAQRDARRRANAAKVVAEIKAERAERAARRRPWKKVLRHPFG